MTVYNSVAIFGTLKVFISDMSASEKPATLKTTFGKTFVEKNIPLRDAKNFVLTVNGLINGLSQTSGQTRATAIENDRATLIALDDGAKHSWNDGKHNAESAIVPGTLIFPDEAVRTIGEPYKFTMVVISW